MSTTYDRLHDPSEREWVKLVGARQPTVRRQLALFLFNVLLLAASMAVNGNWGKAFTTITVISTLYSGALAYVTWRDGVKQG